jgi:hypothetical protein
VCLIQSTELLEHVRHAPAAHKLKENVKPISSMFSPDVLGNMGVGREPTEQVDLALQCPRVGLPIVDRDLLDSDELIISLFSSYNRSLFLL